jgi:hypothetical protein
MSAEVEVQRTLYEGLLPIGLPVYDAAPQAPDGASLATFPYIEVGAIILTPFDTFEEIGFTIAARIHTRSRSRSMLETKTIQGQIYAILHRGALPVAGFRMIDLTRETTECMRVADGSFHGVCEYRGQITTT